MAVWLLAFIGVTPQRAAATTNHSSPSLQTSASQHGQLIQQPNDSAALQISGRVFLDNNANGHLDESEYGIANVLVSGYGDNNQLAGAEVVTDAEGEYVFSIDIPVESEEIDWSRVRLEFTLPETLSYLEPAGGGSSSATTVAFAVVGDKEINVGFMDPATYCQADPSVITSCYLTGMVNGANGGESALVSFPYSATGSQAAYDSDARAVRADTATTEGQLPIIQSLATHRQVGSLYGLAYQRTTGLIYAAAYQKRFSDFGPGGADAIYLLDKSGHLLGTANLEKLLEQSLVGNADLAERFTECEPATSKRTKHFECSGLVNHQAHDFRILAGENSARDNVSYSLSGKNSFGDIEISGDQQTLYIVNMWDRQLYAIDVSQVGNELAGPTHLGNVTERVDESNDMGLGSLPSVSLNDSAFSEFSIRVMDVWETPDSCGSVQHRPMGLAWHQNRLWIGSVCEDASAAFVHSLSPQKGNRNFRREVRIPLTYQRQPVLNLSDSESAAANWQAWSDDPTAFDYAWNNRDSSEISLPQPLLSDIAFDGPHMILGLRDRFGDQSGYRQLHVPAELGIPERPAERLYSGDAAGDILRVCRVADRWVLESGKNGQCVALTGDIGPDAESGPGGEEYYYWDFYPKSGAKNWSPKESVEHFEVSQGGLLQLQTSPYIMTTAMDPFSAFSAGIIRLDNRTGQRVGIGPNDLANSVTELEPGGFTLYATSNSPGTFGKASGLGDLEALCLPAPIEIGNRVWHDSNANGIQDPTESGLAGVSLYLFQNGLLVGRAKTDSEGRYTFGGRDGASLFDDTQLTPHTTYQIRIELAAIDLLDGATPSILNYADNPESQADVQPAHQLHDSNGDNEDLALGFSSTVVHTGLPGGSDHSIDFGFYSPDDLVATEEEPYFEAKENRIQIQSVFGRP